ncbi:SAM-dependent DNA methyltransferase, partial [Escherichia coli]|nr:SAM-dependent DNA methyltransferase [Escherichia coli]
EAENYDLSLSRYKEEIFEEVQYEQPEAILERLIQAEVGNVDKKVLNKVQSGILYELLELKGMIV